MRFLLRSGILLLSIFFISDAGGQNADPYDRQFVYRNWDNQKGLPQNTVNDIIKDEEGFLWAATEEGLIRFDGWAFENKNAHNIPGLSANVFYDISRGRKGIWASGRYDIVHIYSNQPRLFRLESLMGGGWIKCIEADQDGRLWIGTSSGQLLYIEKDSVHHLNGWNPQQGGAVEVIRTHGNLVFIGTARGLFRMEKKSGRIHSYPELSGQLITSLALEKEKLWAGTAESGLFCVAGHVLQLTEKHGLKESYINTVFVTDDGTVWIGTRSSGFQLYHDGRFKNPEQKQYSHDGIKSILVTGPEEVWMGSTSSGLIQMRPAQIQTLAAGVALSELVALPVYQHPEGDIWVGTAGKGVRYFVDGREFHLGKEEGLSSDLVLSLFGYDDFIFIGTADGLDRYNRKTKKIDRHFKKEQGLTTNSIQTVFTDSRKRLWVSTRNGGIHLMEKGRIRKIRLGEELDQTSFITVMEDAEGNLWYGSRGAGMIRVGADGKITRFNRKNGFEPGIVYCFYQDRNKNLWMGTEKGLVGYDHKIFRVFDNTKGLRFNEIYRILEDDAGYVWMSGNPGLQTVPVRSLDEALLKQSGFPAKLFNTVDGMANAEANGGFAPAGWKMKNGDLWFPTVKGVAIVNPHLVSMSIEPVNIRLQELRYSDKVLNPFGKPELPAGTNHIEISYTSIDFYKPGDITYYYRLKGTDDKWVKAGNRRTAYFSGLPHGKYFFEVRAERYGVWSPTAVISFRIAPHFFQTTWFRLILGLSICLILYLFIHTQISKGRRKLQQQRKITEAQLTGQEKERQLIGTELHDNINQQLATAKLYLDFARSSEEMRLPMVEKSEAVVNQVINEIRALCKSIIPPTLKDIGLREALQELLGSYVSVKKFQVHFHCSSALEELEEGVRFTLFRITQEQLNNISKHAEAANVWVDIGVKDGLVQLTIRDDGKGFDTKKLPEGLGLGNIRNRVELYGGHMRIESEPGRGCTLDIEIRNGLEAEGTRVFVSRRKERGFPANAGQQ